MNTAAESTLLGSADPLRRLEPLPGLAARGAEEPAAPALMPAQRPAAQELDSGRSPSGVRFMESFHPAAGPRLLVVVPPVSGDLPAETRAWLARVVADKANREGTLVVLLGTGPEAIAGNTLMNRRSAEPADADDGAMGHFAFWHELQPASRTGQLGDLDHRASAITAVLSGILSHGDGAPRRGIIK